MGGARGRRGRRGDSGYVTEFWLRYRPLVRGARRAATGGASARPGPVCGPLRTGPAEKECVAPDRRGSSTFSVRVLFTFGVQGKAVRTGHSCAAVSHDRPPPRRRTTRAKPFGPTRRRRRRGDRPAFLRGRRRHRCGVRISSLARSRGRCVMRAAAVFSFIASMKRESGYTCRRRWRCCSCPAPVRSTLPWPFLPHPCTGVFPPPPSWRPLSC